MGDGGIRNILIVGGGVAGWLAAASLARMLKPGFCRVGLLDDGLGPQLAAEVARPSFHRLRELLGFDEAELVRDTGATFSLGVEYRDWSAAGERYFQGYAPIGARLRAVPFHHYGLRLRAAGLHFDFEDSSMAAAAAKAGRFAHPAADADSVLARYAYGYHFDATRLAGRLRRYATENGVEALRGRAQGLRQAGDGRIEAVLLQDGAECSADFFVDATAPRSLLADDESGSPWPCNRAVTVSCARSGASPPRSSAVAESAGWRWQVPLADRWDVGYAFASNVIDDDAAAQTLLANLPGAALGEPRIVPFNRRAAKTFWQHNCLALPGAGLLPIEDMRLQLVQTGILRLLTLFPDARGSHAARDEYNRLTQLEHDRVRDFQWLHFKATRREDSPFWRQCAALRVSDTLRERIALFEDSGRVGPFDEDPVGEEAWASVLLGMGVAAAGHDPLADSLDLNALGEAMRSLSGRIHEAAGTLPAHDDYRANFLAGGDAKEPR